MGCGSRGPSFRQGSGRAERRPWRSGHQPPAEGGLSPGPEPPQCVHHIGRGGRPGPGQERGEAAARALMETVRGPGEPRWAWGPFTRGPELYLPPRVFSVPVCPGGCQWVARCRRPELHLPAEAHGSRRQDSPRGAPGPQTGDSRGLHVTPRGAASTWAWVGEGFLEETAGARPGLRGVGGGLCRRPCRSRLALLPHVSRLQVGPRGEQSEARANSRF